MEHTVYMLTTIDNPYSPFTQFREWFTWDEAAGYSTTAFLARVVKTSDELTERDYASAVEEGIDEIIQENVSGMYRKVTKESYPPSYQ